MEIIQMVSLSSNVAGFLKRIYTQAREAVMRGGYRPEKHYMRGPGPKAKAKHQSASNPQSRQRAGVRGPKQPCPPPPTAMRSAPHTPRTILD